MPKVQSSTKSLYEIMATALPYTIPYNQRPYKWSQNNWETLWRAIFEEEEYSNFFGSVILLEDIIKNKREIQIFDGQQRVTTITILIKALVEALHDEGFHTVAGQLYAYLLMLPNNKERIIVSDNLKEYFKNNIQTQAGDKPEDGNSVYEKDIFKAYKYFYKQNKELLKTIMKKNNGKGEDLYDLFISRLQDIEVVSLTIDDVVLGIEIFESVNSTGEKLDASELVKNILIKYAKIEQMELKIIHDEWTEINDRVVESGFKLVEFLHYYWISKHTYTGKANLFRSMKKEFAGSAKKWINFFKDFKKSSETLHSICVDLNFHSFKSNFEKCNNNPNYSWRYIRHLKALNKVSNKSWIIPVITLLNYEKDLNTVGESYISKNFHKLIEKHFVFSFIHFNIFSFPTRDYTPAMYSLSKAINKTHLEYPAPEESKEKINKIFENHWKGSGSYVKKATLEFMGLKKRFYEGVSKLKYKKNDNDLLKIIFSDIVMNNFEGLKPDESKHTFEHYLPQDSKEWGISIDTSKQHSHKIGNLLYIEANVNQSLQNKPHSKKLQILKDKKDQIDNYSKHFLKTHEEGGISFNFGKINEESLKNSDFENNPSEIDKRTKEIASYMWRNYVLKMNNWVK